MDIIFYRYRIFNGGNATSLSGKRRERRQSSRVDTTYGARGMRKIWREGKDMAGKSVCTDDIIMPTNILSNVEYRSQRHVFTVNSIVIRRQRNIIS